MTTNKLTCIYAVPFNRPPLFGIRQLLRFYSVVLRLWNCLYGVNHQSINQSINDGEYKLKTNVVTYHQTWRKHYSLKYSDFGRRNYQDWHEMVLTRELLWSKMSVVNVTKCCSFKLFIFSSTTGWILITIVTKHFLEKEIKVYSMRDHADNNEIVKKVSSRTNRGNFNQTWHKAEWNVGLPHVSRGNKHDILVVKIQWRLLKSLFSRTT